MAKWEAEIILNGPKGMARASVEVQPDGLIQAWAVNAAVAQVCNLYNDMPEPTFGKSIVQGLKTHA